MIGRAVHAIMPLAVIGAAATLCITGHITSGTAVAMIGTAGGAGALVVSGRPPNPPK